jgi:hypothetical protein
MKAGLGFLALAALGVAAALHGDVNTYANASLGASWLNLQSDPRGVAMAGADDSLDTGLAALGANPAGLSGLKALQASFEHSAWVLDLSQEHLSAGLPLAPGSAAAFSVDYLDLGSVDSYSLGANGLPVANGSLHPYAFIGSLGLGRELLPGLDVGATGELLGERLDDSNALDGALDLGGQWHTPMQGLALGLTLKNLGGQLEGASLPVVLGLGSDYAIPLSTRSSSLVVAVGASSIVNSGQAPTLSLGEEFWLDHLLALRTGYQFGDAQSPSGFTAGLGLRHAWLQLDYSYDARGDLGGVQQMSLTIDLAPRPEPTLEATPQPSAAMTPAPNADDYHDVVDAINHKDFAQAQALAAQLSQTQQAKLRQAYDTYISPDVFVGDMAAAEQVALILTQLEPANADYQARLGVIEWHLGKYDEADVHLKRAMVLDPSRVDLKDKLSKP